MEIDEWRDLRGTTVRSADGEPVGKVTAAHVSGRDALLVQISTRDPERELIVPVGSATLGASGLVLPYSAAAVAAGPTVQSDAVLSVGEAAFVLGYYGEGSVTAPGHAITDRADVVGDVADQDPQVRHLPPIVVTRPRLDDGR
ncbi:PRC-barrel domain-containing protein [Asanoa iriomotensis]|uniref:PRC-barrel domain-containing protein n=1 Tax=Asanoa iriomotensis TaxID=234613 RepID=A0ABQ4CFN8_9ACTN|nr:PRC-barrel domain-containing protein [Asanoa iriomotensis]GIF61577.1 hypothetical protein Air01nite_76720 [Asanoa iriomotensis]